MTPQPISDEQRESLKTIREKLLGLHKLLLDMERGDYEREHGPVSSTGEFFSLALGHERFEWLRRLSGIVVEIDGMLSPRTKSSSGEADSLLRELSALLDLREDCDEFHRKYWRAIQTQPDVVIEHCRIRKLLEHPRV